MALGASTFSNLGGAVSDLFAASAFKTKGQGLRAEAEQYLVSAQYAEDNKQFAAQNTAIQEVQAGRDVEKTLGGQQAAIAAGNFANSGSALDIMRDSANQGALKNAILAQQGNITETGFEQQAQSYRFMSHAASMAAGAADKAAQGAEIGSYLKFASAAFSLFPS
jgi:hypothetical protein